MRQRKLNNEGLGRMKRFVVLFSLPLFTACSPSTTELKLGLQGLFIVLALGFLAVLWRSVQQFRRSEPAGTLRPTPYHLLVGAISDFFDTLGIGSFATTTSLYRFRRTVPDELIPGTMNVGHTLPTIAQALIFIQLVPVDATTLLSLIAAAGLGAWFGTGQVARLPRRQIQVGMGSALLIAALIMLLSQLGYLPAGGEANALTGGKLAIGIAGNFLLGMLMPLGVGLYAPCMILVSLLGMNPLAAFPIMMGSCAVLMPISSARFCAAGKYDVPAALGLIAAGMPAVLLAAFLVKSLPLALLRWLVVILVIYVAISLLRNAYRDWARQRLGAQSNAGGQSLQLTSRS